LNRASLTPTKNPVLLATTPTEKILKIRQVDNAETDETGFGGFVTMPLSILAEPFGTKPEIFQYHFHI
jgi:hypothetical protein